MELRQREGDDAFHPSIEYFLGWWFCVQHTGVLKIFFMKSFFMNNKNLLLVIKSVFVHNINVPSVKAWLKSCTVSQTSYQYI